jgi:Fe-S cluster assembly protein SufB
VKKYFMKLVPSTDHKFAALHGAVWSWGTFIYVPKGTKLDQPLQTYFRMNVASGWQFEHTLIIVEDDCEASYIEWCSAPKYNKRSLHAWCVELYIWKNSNMRYSSVENWSIDTYNLNTKRAILEDNAYIEWIWGNFWSWLSMLYPMSILKWDNSKADHLWVAFAAKDQIQDIWSKVVHIGKNTSSNIVSKSICKDGWINTYRWLVKISPSADWATNSTKCDTILIDEISKSDTIPYIECLNANWVIAHEASAGKIDEQSLFYLQSKWISKQTASWLIVNWFASPIIKKLPLEYAWELNRLIEIEME